MIQLLQDQGYTVRDFDCQDTSSADYVGDATAVAEAVSRGAFTRGIVISKTGIEMSISANKVRGIRCALCTTTMQAEMTRRHNDTNILALGAKVTGDALSKEIVSIWLTTEFEGGRHKRRVDKISEYESRQ